jgi:competence protein ComEC
MGLYLKTMEYQRFLREWWKEGIVATLVVANLWVWILALNPDSGMLKVSFFDVGQGDAIFIETPSGKQMLIDGGKNKKIVSELGRTMSFGDRTLDIVLATHPDADHIGGLPEVFKRYDVEVFVEPGVESKNTLDNELHERLRAGEAQTLLARAGEIINFGDGVKLEIIFPHTDVSQWETNDASIVAKLTYGERSFLLTGDAGIKTENILLRLPEEFMDVDVLKAGHHGSRTSTSLSFAQAASPSFAVISAGKDNSYGHPHKEVLKILETVGTEIKSTAESGTITFETDGQELRVK